MSRISYYSTVSPTQWSIIVEMHFKIWGDGLPLPNWEKNVLKHLQCLSFAFQWFSQDDWSVYCVLRTLVYWFHWNIWKEFRFNKRKKVNFNVNVLCCGCGIPKLVAIAHIYYVLQFLFTFACWLINILLPTTTTCVHLNVAMNQLSLYLSST